MVFFLFLLTPELLHLVADTGQKGFLIDAPATFAHHNTELWGEGRAVCVLHSAVVGGRIVDDLVRLVRRDDGRPAGQIGQLSSFIRVHPPSKDGVPLAWLGMLAEEMDSLVFPALLAATPMSWKLETMFRAPSRAASTMRDQLFSASEAARAKVLEAAVPMLSMELS